MHWSFEGAVMMLGMIAYTMAVFNELPVEAWRCIHVFTETKKGGSDVFVFQ